MPIPAQADGSLTEAPLTEAPLTEAPLAEAPLAGAPLLGRAPATVRLAFGIGARILIALTLLLAVNPAPAQNPQSSHGFPRPGQPAGQNPAEMAAYSAAINQSDPDAKASAIQQFLVNYPNSSLRQPAIAQMMLAKRGGASGAGAPPPPAMNRPVGNQPTSAMSTPPASAAAPVAPMQPAGPPRDSLLQHPAKPALVTVAPHSLTVKADNSSLSQILHEISSTTGMKIDGLAQDDRVFGDYGPGDAREVLLSLLQGSGYNVLMVGNVNGAPRQLSLSQRTASTAVGAGQVNRSPRQEEDDSDDEIQQVPPEPQPAPGGTPQGTDPNAQRNPAELQQEMLRLRQQEQQREQQQNQPPQPQPQ